MLKITEKFLLVSLFIENGGKMKVLLLGFNDDLEDIIEFYLKEKKYEVYKYEESFLDLEKSKMDILLIDLQNKIENLKKLFSNFSLNSSKIIAVVNGKDINQIKYAFELGVDDIVKTPVEISEIYMRIGKYEERLEKIVRYNSIQIDLEKYQVKEYEKIIELSRLEFELLLYIIQNKDRVIKRSEIMEKVWQKKNNERIIDVYVAKLRKKLYILKNKLRAIKGLGYKLD